jgi:hypothetical protein
VREKNEDAPRPIPASGWAFLDDGAIVLLPRGTPFRAGALYQFTYRARNPPVAGIGYAATRDWVAFLRYAAKDKAGNANPLGIGASQKITAALAHGTSQSGRFLRDMVYNGFNEADHGERVEPAHLRATPGSGARHRPDRQPCAAAVLSPAARLHVQPAVGLFCYRADGRLALSFWRLAAARARQIAYSGDRP